MKEWAQYYNIGFNQRQPHPAPKSYCLIKIYFLTHNVDILFNLRQTCGFKIVNQ